MNSSREMNVSYENIVEIGKCFEQARSELVCLIQQKTVYDKIGGEGAISKAADIIYDRIVQDERINIFYLNIHID